MFATSSHDLSIIPVTVTVTIFKRAIGEAVAALVHALARLEMVGQMASDTRSLGYRQWVLDVVKGWLYVLCIF
jgi:hypothetical protein